MRDLHVICYDIVDDTRRSNVAHVLEGYGVRIQESLFELYGDTPQLRRLRRRLEDLIDPLTDNIRLYSLCRKDARARLAFGDSEQAVDYAYILE